MKKIQKAAAMAALALVLASCSIFMPKTTPTVGAPPEPTFTRTLPPSLTLTPGETYQPLWMPDVIGSPVAAWEGVPIMPAAIQGVGEGSSYSFTVKMSLDDVKQYYDNELPKVGWTLFATGQGSPDTLLLMFSKGADVITLSAFKQKGGLVYVTLEK